MIASQRCGRRRQSRAPRASWRSASCLLLFAAAIETATAASGDFLYHAQPRDTLIGIGRRLLLEPRRWHEVQTLNHIGEPRRIPPGSIVRIPYEWLRLAPRTATVVAVAGTVQSDGKLVAVGDVLPQGALVETGVDGSLTLDLADGSVVSVRKSSVLRLDEMVEVAGAGADSIRLKLDSGRIETRVRPHRDVGRFEIITPVAVSAVRGTEFRDGFTSDDPHATTETLDGTVAVSAGAAAVAVGAGFGTRVEKDRPPLQPVMLLPPPNLAAVPAVNSTSAMRIELAPVAGAHEYRVQLSADETFHALAADVKSARPSLIVPDLPDGDFWLRARSIDALGLEGADAVRRIVQHVLPDAPQASSPAGGAKLEGSPVHLAWTSPAPARSYRLEVAANPAFAAPVISLTDLRQPQALVDLAPGTYYWRAAALNAAGEAGPWSEARSLTERPPMPMPDEPRLAGSRLVFGWRAVPGDGYRVQISRHADFSRPLIDQRTDAAVWSLPKPFPGGYFVRVQSIDADGVAGAFSPPRSYSVPLPWWLGVAGTVVLGLAFLL